jgi:hypothetical protein
MNGGKIEPSYTKEKEKEKEKEKIKEKENEKEEDAVSDHSKHSTRNSAIHMNRPPSNVQKRQQSMMVSP